MSRLFFYLLIFVVIVALELWYKDSLYEVTLESVPGMQESLLNSLNGWPMDFFKFLTLFGDKAIAWVIFLMLYLLSTREKCFYFLCLFVT